MLSRSAVSTNETLLIDLHNETGDPHPNADSDADVLTELCPVNIHSHLEAALVFIWFLCTFDSAHLSTYQSVSWADYAVFVIFLSSAVFCLFGSALFHMSTAHSKEVRLMPRLCGLILIARAAGLRSMSCLRLFWNYRYHLWRRVPLFSSLTECHRN